MSEGPGDVKEEARFIPLDKTLAVVEVWFDDIPVGQQKKPIETFYTPLISKAHTQAMLERNLPHITECIHGPYQLTLNHQELTCKPREESNVTAQCCDVRSPMAVVLHDIPRQVREDAA